MHDTIMLVIGCRGDISNVPTNPADVTPKSRISVSVLSFGAKEQG